MNRLERLQAASSLSDLAKLLNYTPTGLAYVLYKTPKETLYRTFEIPKSGGGVRTIQAPKPQLKLVQGRLADLLSDCLDKIEAEKQDRKKVSHGFQRGRSIVTNAKAHRMRRFVLNLDLNDFFGTINFGRVRGFFIADRNFMLSPKVATVIAQIACHNNTLPQGAPCSPVISNLIGNILDARLIRLARDHGCTYTRYADDLTFSTNRRNFPRQLARPKIFKASRWIIGKQLKDAIKQTGFSINSSKTRMQIRGSRQEVTGLVVNEKVNIRQEYYRSVRSMCSSLFHTGEYYVEKSVSDGSEEPERTTKLAPLEGRLAHIYYIKTRRDISQRDKKLHEFKSLKAPKELYRRFLFYKYFIASDKPVLVTEGKTDIIYLRSAIKALQEKYPELLHIEDDQTQLSVHFLNSSNVNIQVLNLGQGFHGMTKVINSYALELKRYGFLPLAHPVIFIVDNDKGGEAVLKAADRVSQGDVKPSSTDTFFHIQRNLYLVKTPPGSDGGLSAIEDCFPEEVLKQEIGGKSLDLNKKHGDETSFGKQVFAEMIVRPGVGKIDFSGFTPILEGISESMEHYFNLKNKDIVEQDSPKSA
jgi:RNA-directed DNA polymerase